MELKTNNHNLEEDKRLNQTEIQILRQRVEDLEKQLSSAPNETNEADNNFVENENLKRKMEAQEQQIKDLLTENQSLITKNNTLEQQLKTFRGVESHSEAIDDGSDWMVYTEDMINSSITIDRSMF